MLVCNLQTILKEVRIQFCKSNSCNFYPNSLLRSKIWLLAPR